MPDGRRVIFGGTRDGKSESSCPPMGASSRVAARDRRGPQCRRRSRRTEDLYFTRAGQDGRLAIAVLSPVEGAKATDIRPFRESGAAGNDSNAQVSSDGQWVALESTESGTREIYVQSAQGTGKTRISTMGGRGPRWGRNNRELLYWGNTPGNPALILVPVELTPSFRPGTPQELFRLGAGTTWDVAPGGEKFLVEVSRISTGATLAAVTNWFDELRRRAPIAKK
jgi:Tol biopolymer transport system component